MFKKALLCAALGLSSSAFAAPNACVDFMPCGTYEGNGRDYDRKDQVEADTEFFETITLAATADPLVLTLKQAMYTTTTPAELFYELDLTVTFQEDGSYKAVRNQNGKLFATGLCQTGKVCGLAMIPFENSLGSVTGNVNVLRFENGKLTRSMMAEVQAGDLGFQRSELLLKP